MKRNSEVLFSNSIADLYCDEDNNIWIGTAKGLNPYNRKTGQMAFVSGKNGFPNGYYKFFFKDQSGVLWLGVRANDGLYTYNPIHKTLKGISTHPQLKRFAGLEVWTMMQDRKGRFWYGFDENGLGFYDP